MRIVAVALAVFGWASVSYADAIDDYAAFTTRELVDDGITARLSVMEAAKARYGLTDEQMTEFGACIRGAARHPQLRLELLANAAAQCGRLVKSR